MGLFAGVVTLPRWFARSLWKHRLWVLRDCVVDDVIDQRLPYDHPAVRDLVQRLEMVVHDMAHMHIVDMWAWRRAYRNAPPTAQEELLKGSGVRGLSEQQIARVCEHRERMLFLTTSMIFTGSWIGIGYVARFAAPKMLCAIVSGDFKHPARAEREAETALRNATQEAVSTTGLGRELQKFVGFKFEHPHRSLPWSRRAGSLVWEQRSARRCT
jgi:hypothetical protein